MCLVSDVKSNGKKEMMATPKEGILSSSAGTEVGKIVANHFWDERLPEFVASSEQMSISGGMEAPPIAGETPFILAKEKSSPPVNMFSSLSMARNKSSSKLNKQPLARRSYTTGRYPSLCCPTV